LNCEQVELAGTVTTWALEEDGSKGHKCTPLRMKVPMHAFDGLPI